MVARLCHVCFRNRKPGIALCIRISIGVLFDVHDICIKAVLTRVVALLDKVAWRQTFLTRIKSSWLIVSMLQSNLLPAVVTQ